MNALLAPCLRLLAGDARNARDCLPALQELFHLTEDEMSETIPSGLRTRVFDRADWSIFHLMKAGLVDRPKRRVYRSSAAGDTLLASKHEPLTLQYLATLPAYQIAMKGSPLEDASVATSSTGIGKGAVAPTSETPDEAIARAYRESEGALADELLSAMQIMHPTKFEQLIVDLLLAMGYGGGDQSMGERIGKSGDGGIDGIINEDALGLDAVYIQAKRYAPENRIGRPALQAFVGSLTGEGANKGVFVTTSDFSKEARDYLTRVQHRIVLINGDRLARLMIQHEVGVRARKTYVLRSVDEDYFAEF
jgi:restriction system protein